MKIIRYIFLLIICVGCHPSTAEDCQREAKGLIKSLTVDLKEVKTKEDLIAIGSKIEKKTQSLVTLMIQLKKLQEKGIIIPEDEDHLLSHALMHEMKRIYHIEGGREFIERSQRKALFHLDTFYQRRKK